MDRKREIQGLTFIPFSMYEARPRSPASILVGDTVVGYRDEADGMRPERVRAVGGDPDIQAVLEAAHKEFMAAEERDREEWQRQCEMEAAERQAKVVADARAALFPREN